MDISLGALDRALKDEAAKFVLMREIARRMSRDLGPESNLPELSTEIFRFISRQTGVLDPFKAEKEECNRVALPIAQRLSSRILTMENPLERLRAAALASIAGNTMDLGTSGHSFNLAGFEEEHQRIARQGLSLDDTPELLRVLGRTSHVIYLADNAGEIAFDKILVCVISGLGAEVTVAVKGGPISNDATMEDAEFVGMGEVARLITTGTDHLGVSLASSSSEFLEAFRSSDLVVSKGQSNLETLSYEPRGISQPVAYVLKAKCPPIAKALGCKLGDNVLKIVHPD